MKLHANELRIGNYVLSGFMNPTPTGLKKCYNQCEVKAIGIEKLLVTEKIGKKGLEKHNYDNIKSITLTEEWLLRFKEIQRIDEGLFSIDGERYIELTFKGDGYNVDLGGIVVCFVDTVHALQNAVFVILGTELTLIK